MFYISHIKYDSYSTKMSIPPLHNPAQILDVDIEAFMRHPVLSKFCNIVGTASMNRNALNVPVYYINPDKYQKRRNHMENQLIHSGVPKHRIHRIKAENFPMNSSQQTKVSILKNNHIRAWKQALLDRNSDERAPGVVIMEDDVCLLNGWRFVLNELVLPKSTDTLHGRRAEHCAHIVRFDTLPQYESSRENIPANGLVFSFPCVSKFCNGAYFMSWQSLRSAVRVDPDSFANNEDIIHAVGQSLSTGRYIQCIPPLAIQTWFLHRDTNEDAIMLHKRYRGVESASTLQTKHHMRKLRTTLFQSLLEDHGHKYHIPFSLRKTMENIKDLFYNPRSKDAYPVVMFKVFPEFVIKRINDSRLPIIQRPTFSRVSEEDRKSSRCSSTKYVSLTKVVL